MDEFSIKPDGRDMRIDWRVRNVMDRLTGPDASHESPTFKHAGAEWSMQIRLSDKSYVQFALARKSTTATHDVRYLLGRGEKDMCSGLISKLDDGIGILGGCFFTLYDLWTSNYSMPQMMEMALYCIMRQTTTEESKPSENASTKGYQTTSVRSERNGFGHRMGTTLSELLSHSSQTSLITDKSTTTQTNVPFSDSSTRGSQAVPTIPDIHTCSTQTSSTIPDASNTSSQTNLSISKMNQYKILDLLPNDFRRVYANCDKLWAEVLNCDDCVLNLCPESRDCVLKVGESKFPVHSAVLSARSTTFEAMLNNVTSGSPINEVEIYDIPSTTLNDVLHYIYTGRIRGLTTDTVEPMYAAANKLSLPELQETCLSFLNSNPDN